MPGFDFSNHNRNLALHAQGVPLPKATSTGTTIVGCLYDGGVVIAADTRATSGPIVADKVGSSFCRNPGTITLCPQSLTLHDFHRTAKSSTTSPLRSGAQAPVPQQTPNSLPPSSLPISSFILSPLAASPELPLS